MHEDLNRVIQKPYVEQKESAGRPDKVISLEYWDGFLARNRSIIVDLMYGQLKSTVKCLTCENISITFDPFLTLALPIARPFKLTVRFIPFNQFVEKEMIGGGSAATRNPIMTYSIPLTKESTIADLKRFTSELAGLPGPQ